MVKMSICNFAVQSTTREMTHNISNSIDIHDGDGSSSHGCSKLFLIVSLDQDLTITKSQCNFAVPSTAREITHNISNSIGSRHGDDSSSHGDSELFLIVNADQRPAKVSPHTTVYIRAPVNTLSKHHVTFP